MRPSEDQESSSQLLDYIPLSSAEGRRDSTFHLDNDRPEPTSLASASSLHGDNMSVVSQDENEFENSSPIPRASSSAEPSTAPSAKKTSPRSHRARVKAILAGWCLEIIWLSISCGCFCALVILLERFDDQPIPNWPLGSTINTAIALLSTISRTGFVVPVAESIAQLKWIWYQKERPLADLQTFDEASRGPWGSLKLLISMRTKSWILGLLPAIVLTTSILTSTLTQSVVTYPTRYEPINGTAQATVLRAVEYWTTSANSYWQRTYVGKLTREIHAGLNYPPEISFDLDPPTCATSECRWPLFDTLEVCTKTWNVTQHLNHTFDNFGPKDASLPNGVSVTTGNVSFSTTFLWLVNGYAPISWDANSPSLNATALSNFFLIYTTRNKGPFAIEVLFHLCVNKYNVSVNENVVSRKTINSSIDIITKEMELGIYDNRPANVTAILSPDDGRVGYPFGGEGLHWMRTALSVTMNGSYHDGDGLDTGSVPNRFESMLDNTFSSKFRDQGVEDPIMEVVANISRNIAASLSHGLIETIQRGGYLTDAIQVVGENLAPVTFVNVRWPWISLLASQIGLSIGFVVIVITRTSKSGLGIVKSSLLPVLFAINPEERALIEDGPQHAKYQEELTKISTEASGIVGQLSMGGKRRGWTLAK